jgi:hypothetical protein
MRSLSPLGLLVLLANASALERRLDLGRALLSAGSDQELANRTFVALQDLAVDFRDFGMSGLIPRQLKCANPDDRTFIVRNLGETDILLKPFRPLPRYDYDARLLFSWHGLREQRMLSLGPDSLRPHKMLRS